jgi:V8-like Glu-specific endopeptidase
MRPLIVTVILVLLFLLSYKPADGANWAKIAERTVESLVKLETYNYRKGDMTGLCTAFVIDKKEGLAWTAAHCVAHPRNDFISVPPQIDGIPVVLKGVGPRYDLSLLQHEAFTKVKRELKWSEGVSIGDDLMLVGFESNHIWGPIVRRGSVHAVASGWLLASFMSEGGNSGSPVMDEDGKVVGMAVTTAAFEDVTTILTGDSMAYAKVLYSIGLHQNK